MFLVYLELTGQENKNFFGLVSLFFVQMLSLQSQKYKISA